MVNFCASVINKTVTPWNEKKQTIGVKHTILISQDINGRFIDSDEAYYICGILNSPIVRDYIVHTFKSNGISLNKSNIYLPLYDPTNQLHIEIANLAKDASYGQGNIDDICLKIDKLYIKICKKQIRYDEYILCRADRHIIEKERREIAIAKIPMLDEFKKG
jgi:hypothetical protein